MNNLRQSKDTADLLIHHASVVTVDPKFRIFEAIAVKDGRVLRLGDDETIFKLRGPKTEVIDADGNSVLPGLDQDSRVVRILAIGVKERDRLLISGEEVEG
jgi:adenine deaminase